MPAMTVLLVVIARSKASKQSPKSEIVTPAFGGLAMTKGEDCHAFLWRAS
jgi:hypothetical protein